VENDALAGFVALADVLHQPEAFVSGGTKGISQLHYEYSTGEGGTQEKRAWISETVCLWSQIGIRLTHRELRSFRRFSPAAARAEGIQLEFPGRSASPPVRLRDAREPP
jgi:hypothetical protein